MYDGKCIKAADCLHFTPSLSALAITAEHARVATPSFWNAYSISAQPTTNVPTRICAPALELSRAGLLRALMGDLGGITLVVVGDEESRTRYEG